jgi:hypothetical protein
MAVFWVVAPCRLVEVYQRFRGPCCLHHQGDESLQPRRQHLRTHRRENLKSYNVNNYNYIESKSVRFKTTSSVFPRLSYAAIPPKRSHNRPSYYCTYKRDESRTRRDNAATSPTRLFCGTVEM